ncbi:unnamed protein product [Caenorhabditis bovis]|uniref:TRUD domain-containing protein n=1 Tax=Caenorhabditis bovis TaxID=2654633 RepID=A0A8S1EAC7_9PELO|nr:unnamed protein product [Caenorhabditis bovis]
MSSLFNDDLLKPHIPRQGLPQGFKVRPLNSNDFSNGYLELLSQLTTVGDVSREKFMERFESMMNTNPKSYYITVIEDEASGKVVASASLVLEWKFIHEAGSRGRIEDVVTSKDYRGRNFSSFLNALLVSLAKSLGVYKMSLECVESLMETSFGLTEYVSAEKITEIPCLLKELYTDFIVQEILADKTVLEVPTAEDVLALATNEEKITINENVEIPTFLTDDHIKAFDERFNQKGNLVIVPVEGMDKDRRKAVHQFIRERYSGKLISELKPEGICVSHGHTNSSRKRKIWDEKTPKECHFTMAKENKDTVYSLGVIAKFLNVDRKLVKMCGIKDKRAVTVQRVSCRQVEEKKILSLNSRLRNILVYDCKYFDNPLQMGGHWGNRFSIILRNINENDVGVLESRLTVFETLGFVNYFGTQRFGSRDANTARVGLDIVKRDWEAAVKAILKNTLSPMNQSGTLGEAIRHFCETGDARAAYKKLRGAQTFATIEGTVLKHLGQGGTWQTAITEAIPIQTRSLYVHAYQSLIWNKVASRRVREAYTQVTDTDVGFDGQPLPADSSHFDIHIPLPGINEKFKDTQAYKWTSECLAEDGVTHESFAPLRDRFAIGESSRPLFGRVEDVSWQFIKHPEPRSFLQDGLYTRAIPDDQRNGPFTALQIKFNLASGCYATTALRQITGVDMGKTAMKANSEELRGAAAQKEENCVEPDEILGPV